MPFVLPCVLLTKPGLLCNVIIINSTVSKFSTKSAGTSEVL